MKNILTIYLMISLVALQIILLNIKKDNARLKPIMKEAHYLTLVIISFTPLAHLAVIVLAVLNKATIDIYELISMWR